MHKGLIALARAVDLHSPPSQKGNMTTESKTKNSQFAYDLLRDFSESPWAEGTPLVKGPERSADIGQFRNGRADPIWWICCVGSSE